MRPILGRDNKSHEHRIKKHIRSSLFHFAECETLPAEAETQTAKRTGRCLFFSRSWVAQNFALVGSTELSDGGWFRNRDRGIWIRRISRASRASRVSRGGVRRPRVLPCILHARIWYLYIPYIRVAREKNLKQVQSASLRYIKFRNLVRPLDAGSVLASRQIGFFITSSNFPISIKLREIFA